MGPKPAGSRALYALHDGVERNLDHQRFWTRFATDVPELILILSNPVADVVRARLRIDADSRDPVTSERGRRALAAMTKRTANWRVTGLAEEPFFKVIEAALEYAAHESEIAAPSRRAALRALSQLHHLNVLDPDLVRERSAE